jgi:APA family basic amino acid/polyamine antiporter
MNALIALSLLTSVTAMVQAGPRVYARMARDGVLPRLFRLKAGAPPRSAIVLQVGLAAVAVLVTGLQGLLSYLGFTLSLSLAFAVSSLFVLHLRDGERPPGRFYPWAPAAFVASTVTFATLSASREPAQFFAAAATVAAGVAAYRLTVRRG